MLPDQEYSDIFNKIKTLQNILNFPQTLSYNMVKGQRKLF